MFTLVTRSMKENSPTLRETYCAELRAFGVAASLAPLGRPEESCPGHFAVFSGLTKDDPGAALIDVRGSPIRWVNVVAYLGDDHVTVNALYYYGVPDARRLPRIGCLRGTRVRTFPLFGRVVDVRWRGDDHGMSIVSSLSADAAIKEGVMGLGSFLNDPCVEFCPEHSCWVLTQPRYLVDSRGKWDLFERIAERLLAAPLPG